MVEKIPVKMVLRTFGVVKNIGKTLFVSTDETPITVFNEACRNLSTLSPNKKYNCTGNLSFFEKKVVVESFIITTDYGSKCNAYFCFMFHIFLENPTISPTICVSWG